MLLPASGGGNFDGPASSTDNAIARFDGTTGKVVQNSGVTVDDGGTVTIAEFGASLNLGNFGVTSGAINMYGIGRFQFYGDGNASYLTWDNGIQIHGSASLPVQIPDAGLIIGGSSTAATTLLTIKAAASQSAVLVQLQGISSTATAREQVDLDTAWVDSTDATRKARHIRRVWDTSARETAREWADGTDGRVAVSAPASAPTDAHLANGQISFYLDEVGNKLKFRVKYSDGTLKTGEVALT